MPLSQMPHDRLSVFEKTLAAEQMRRKGVNKLSQYRPYPKQRLFHNLGRTCTERLLRAGNQQGKTHAGAMEMAMHLTGRYPQWWEGRRFDHGVEAWASCDTGETTRDNPQRVLLGPVTQWGTGAIPEDALIDAKRGRGVADLIDTVLVRHASGGVSRLGFKRYDQGREAWQGPSKHVIWCDEEPPIEIYSEALARLVATRGLIYLISATVTALWWASDLTRRVNTIEGSTVTAERIARLETDVRTLGENTRELKGSINELVRELRKR